MSALEQAWSVLKNEDIFRKRPILGHRILTPVRDESEEDFRARRERYNRPILSGRARSISTPRSFSQRATGNNNTQISAGGDVRTNLPQEPSPQPSPQPSPMDLAMEEIRAAQKQREEQAKKFEEMMSGSFAAAFPQNISQEMADMIAAFKLQGMSNEQAAELARQQLGE